jgi:hypothetical protein
MVLFGFLSHYSSSRLCLAHALVAAFSQGSVPIIYSACLFSPTGAFFVVGNAFKLPEGFFEPYICKIRNQSKET